jgi:hypothetical protein
MRQLLLSAALLAVPAMAAAPSDIVGGACNIATPQMTVPVPATGEVTIRWHFGLKPRCGYWGCATEVKPGVYELELREPVTSWSDACPLIVLGHEVAHAMGARHP